MNFEAIAKFRSDVLLPELIENIYSLSESSPTPGQFQVHESR